MMTPAPLFEKPAKQELPQPARAAAKRMTTQHPKRRRSRLEECSNSSLDRAIRPPSNRPLMWVFYPEKVAHDGRFIKNRQATSADELAPMFSTEIRLNKTNDDAAEFFRLFEVHQVPRIRQNHASRTVDPRFDHAGVGVLVEIHPEAQLDHRSLKKKLCGCICRKSSWNLARLAVKANSPGALTSALKSSVTAVVSRRFARGGALRLPRSLRRARAHRTRPVEAPRK